MLWNPSREFIESTNVWRFMQRLGYSDREGFLAFSRQDPDRFWREVLRETGVEWFEPFTRVVDTSRGVEWAQWFLDGRLNIAHNCLDRWAASGRVACLWEGESGNSRTLTFAQLQADSNRVANGLRALGLEVGDRVALCLPMIPEILSILYGCFKLGLTVVPVFAGFGTGAIESRLRDSGAKALFTADHLERRGKRLPLAEKMPPFEGHTILVNGPLFPDQPSQAATLSLASEHRAFLLYTSGTTGRPKGTVHTHAGCLAQMGKEIWLAFDHRDSDRFFWLSDIGWMMGPWTILGNHLFGGTILLYDGAPDYPTPARLWQTIERHGITTFGVSPTAIRVLGKSGVGLPPMDSLRLLGSTGEPWDDASWLWFFERVGRRRCPIINISGGTEIVGCFLLPLPIQPLKPCSLGGPAPGMATEVVDETGAPVRGRKGYLVCTKPAPSMTRGIWNDPKRYIDTYWSRFPGMWYHGDWASVDEDGHWFLHGRADESMNVAGRKIGPAEVEEAMMRHPGVAESAVIGVPDEIKGEAIVGYAVAKPGAALDPAGIAVTVVDFLGPTFRPREILVVAELPKTQSGKIVRRLIRRKYLGEDLGDLSTVANPWSL
ncbi:MAG TPA: AMP-binding protein [Candidatus Acidoferrales bacterium]|nr:AMP-binding protein [Bryobacteraceae bacterium]HTS62477.1 AMP-binding protein [Candidatus Acidoferrales bacterium]